MPVTYLDWYNGSVTRRDLITKNKSICLFFLFSFNIKLEYEQLYILKEYNV